MNETTSAQAAPLYRVQRWQRRGWRNVTAPLPRTEAEAQAGELKRRPQVSAFHVRLVEVQPDE